MSRSYKHFPQIIQEKGDYHYLNRQLRHDRLAEIPKGSAYKKFNSCNGTWSYRYSKEQAIQDYYEKPWIRERYSYNEWINKWKSWCFRK